jgi:hypothetical protein
MRKTTFGILARSAIIGAAAVAPLGAQVVREGARTSIDAAQVTFGYVCDDRFLVRNEGTTPVRLEYGLDKGGDLTSLDLEGRESVELLLSTSDRLNLLSGGKVIASARRDYRDCDDDRETVIVHRPAVVVQPTVVVASYSRYHYYDPFYPRHVYFRPVVRPVISIPIIIGHSSSGSRDRDRGHDRGSDHGNDRGRRR